MFQTVLKDDFCNVQIHSPDRDCQRFHFKNTIKTGKVVAKLERVFDLLPSFHGGKAETNTRKSFFIVSPPASYEPEVSLEGLSFFLSFSLQELHDIGTQFVRRAERKYHTRKQSSESPQYTTGGMEAEGSISTMVLHKTLCEES